MKRWIKLICLNIECRSKIPEIDSMNEFLDSHITDNTAFEIREIDFAVFLHNYSSSTSTILLRLLQNSVHEIIFQNLGQYCKVAIEEQIWCGNWERISIQSKNSLFGNCRTLKSHITITKTPNNGAKTPRCPCCFFVQHFVRVLTIQRNLRWSVSPIRFLAHSLYFNLHDNLSPDEISFQWILPLSG